MTISYYFSFNPPHSHVTLTTNMEAQLSHLPSPRLPRLVSQLEPLLPGKQGDNKRKRLNAVLDKLTNNINKVSEDASGGDEPDSPDKSLEIELNVKTKFRKEESEDTSGESCGLQNIIPSWTSILKCPKRFLKTLIFPPFPFLFLKYWSEYRAMAVSYQLECYFTVRPAIIIVIRLLY